MALETRSFIAMGLLGSAVVAALRALRKASDEKEKGQQEAAIEAWEDEGGSSPVRPAQERTAPAADGVVSQR